MVIHPLESRVLTGLLRHVQRLTGASQAVVLQKPKLVVHALRMAQQIHGAGTSVLIRGQPHVCGSALQLPPRGALIKLGGGALSHHRHRPARSRRRAEQHAVPEQRPAPLRRHHPLPPAASTAAQLYRATSRMARQGAAQEHALNALTSRARAE